jgi:ketosteroid isomerase-like protein
MPSQEGSSGNGRESHRGPNPETRSWSTSDLADVVSRYLTALDSYDLDAALECFTTDVFYSHPPYSATEGNDRHEVVGRESLRRLFEFRGPKQIRYELDHTAIQGNRGFVEAHFSTDRGDGSFVSVVELAQDGRIQFYAAYRSIPPVGKTRRAGITSP